MVAEPQVRTGFDSAERERVRAALRRYMQENRIGTPTLQYRIIEADQPRRREIPLSTLQRFITGSHHTQDHHVALCHAFVKELPYYGEGRDLAQLGEALFAFVQAQMQEVMREALAGTFEFRGFAPEFGLPNRTLPFPPEKEASGSLTLTAVPGRPYLHAQEFTFDPLIADEAPDYRHACEGVMIVTDPRLYICLRDSLTRLPKMYCLARRPESSGSDNAKVLEGESFETRFMIANPEDGLTRRRRVQFIAAPAMESA